MNISDEKFEVSCPGCHSGDCADFDHYCDSAGIAPGEEPAAFAAWLNAISGWDGPMGQVEPDQEHIQEGGNHGSHMA